MAFVSETQMVANAWLRPNNTAVNWELQTGLLPLQQNIFPFDHDINTALQSLLIERSVVAL